MTNDQKTPGQVLPNEHDFEQWYATHAFDYAANPIGSRECGLQRAAWHAAIAAVLAHDRANQPAASGLWQPIETAPKDGTPIILCRGSIVTSGYWVLEEWPTQAEYHSRTGEYLGQFETGECIEPWWFSQNGEIDNSNPPEVWQPLPSAPEAPKP
jgi:hypothetical protein